MGRRRGGAEEKRGVWGLGGERGGGGDGGGIMRVRRRIEGGVGGGNLAAVCGRGWAAERPVDRACPPIHRSLFFFFFSPGVPTAGNACSEGVPVPRRDPRHKLAHCGRNPRPQPPLTTGRAWPAGRPAAHAARARGVRATLRGRLVPRKDGDKEACATGRPTGRARRRPTPPQLHSQTHVQATAVRTVSVASMASPSTHRRQRPRLADLCYTHATSAGAWCPAWHRSPKDIPPNAPLHATAPLPTPPPPPT